MKAIRLHRLVFPALFCPVGESVYVRLYTCMLRDCLSVMNCARLHVGVCSRAVTDRDAVYRPAIATFSLLFRRCLVPAVREMFSFTRLTSVIYIDSNTPLTQAGISCGTCLSVCLSVDSLQCTCYKIRSVSVNASFVREFCLSLVY